MKYLKSTARLLHRNYVNKRGLDLSKEVLWVSVGQFATKLQAVRVGALKKVLSPGAALANQVRTGPSSRIFSNLHF